MEQLIMTAVKTGSPFIMLFVLFCIVIWLVYKSWGNIFQSNQQINRELIEIIKKNTESNTKLIDTISSLNEIIIINNTKIDEVEKNIQYCRIKNEGKK